jgi:hypothetical protein
MNIFTLVLILSLLLIGLVGYGIYAAVYEASVVAGFILGLVSGMVVTSLGQLYSLISIWLQVRIEEGRMRNNLQENLALMTLTARIQSRQGVALARENSVLTRALTGRQRSETKALPAPAEALLWDETIYDEPENGPDWEIS